MDPKAPLPQDSTSGGAAKLATMKSFKRVGVLKDISPLRTSPSIARQELLSFVRLLIRDCFNGQLADPIMHMNHEGGLDDPAKFWVSRGPEFERPVFSFTKARLMGHSIPQMWPDLLRLMVHYWFYSEKTWTPELDENSELFRTRLAHVVSHADPRLVRETPSEGSDRRSEKRSDSQRFVDSLLEKYSSEELQLLFAKNASLTPEARQRRFAILDEFAASHAAFQKTLSSKERFPCPPNVMVRRRAEELFQTRSKA
ncbi:hypothetical protein KW797_02495 [Candidatus Parcubacteria bacterium]|nr:hypothetical protein [Candidatus Parcubacteria bacterium]